MTLVADVEGRVVRNWIVQVDGSWKLAKLKVAEYTYGLLLCPLHPKSRKEETHWTSPDGREENLEIPQQFLDMIIGDLFWRQD